MFVFVIQITHKIIIIIPLLIFTLLINPMSVYSYTVQINEFSSVSKPQRVEILNIGSRSADISGWFIDDEGGKTFFTIPEKTILFPNFCAVFEGNFYLNKTTPDTIRLFDNTANPTSKSAHLVDQYSYTQKLSPGQSFSRTSNGKNWIVTNSSFGFFNQTSQTCIYKPLVTHIPTITPTPISTLTPTPTLKQNAPTLTNYDGILISEAMPNPNNKDKEWVELFNNNTFEVKLTEWYIDDESDAGSSPHKFSVSIQPHSYIVITLPSMMLNNDGDIIRLLDSIKQEKSHMKYNYSEKGKSWGLVNTATTSQICLQNHLPIKRIIHVLIML